MQKVQEVSTRASIVYYIGYFYGISNIGFSIKNICSGQNGFVIYSHNSNKFWRYFCSHGLSEHCASARNYPKYVNLVYIFDMKNKVKANAEEYIQFMNREGVPILKVTLINKVIFKLSMG